MAVKVFGNQSAYGGETLETTTVFNVGRPHDTTVGWVVRLGVTRRTAIGRPGDWVADKIGGKDNLLGRFLYRWLVRTWNDRTFVVVPPLASDHA